MMDTQYPVALERATERARIEEYKLGRPIQITEWSAIWNDELDRAGAPRAYNPYRPFAFYIAIALVWLVLEKLGGLFRAGRQWK